MVFLKVISLSKQLFVHEMEQGGEVIIPIELSQDRLPISFRYYDPILKICLKEASREKKDFFAVKNQFNFRRIYENSLKANIYNYIGD